MVAKLGENDDGGRSHATRSTGDEDVAVRRLHPLLLQRHDAEHGGVARDTHRHAVGRRPALRHRHQPVAVEAGHFREAAVMALAHAIAIEHHMVARLPARVGRGTHHTGEVDAGDQRKAPRDGRLAGDVEAVLVIDR